MTVIEELLDLFFDGFEVFLFQGLRIRIRFFFLHLPELLNVFGEVVVQLVDVIDCFSVIEALHGLTDPVSFACFPR